MGLNKEPVTVEAKNLKVFYKTEGNPVRAVDGVSFQLYRNEILGIVGESGCGKSTLGVGLMNLVRPPCYIESGEVYFKGKDLLKMNEEELRQLRIVNISLIPQSSMNALNPIMKIKDQIGDGIIDHQSGTPYNIGANVLEVLKMVGLPSETANMYPHELSGGMRQRATLAISLVLKPEFIIADEPTTALDVVVQRAVLEFLSDFKKKFGSSIIVITHDIALVSEICDRIAVMYAGKIVEIGDLKDIFKNPINPYTKMLIEATPSLTQKKRLVGLTGRPPSLQNPPAGCRFASRCPYSKPICAENEPTLFQITPGHLVACYINA